LESLPEDKGSLFPIVRIGASGYWPSN
jgi:hypothetical protein